MQTTLERHRSKLAEEALLRAQGNTSIANYAAIYKGFEAKGIAEEDITPRVNVLTFEAWRAKGRTVKKGEHGIKIFTRVNGVKRQKDGSDKAYIYPKMTTVFHISQTAEAAAEVKTESKEEKAFFDFLDILQNRTAQEDPDPTKPMVEMREISLICDNTAIFKTQNNTALFNNDKPLIEDFVFTFEPETITPPQAAAIAAPLKALNPTAPGKRNIFAIMNKGKQDELKF